MRSDTAKIIDALLTSDKINADEKEAIRMSIDDSWIESEWTRVRRVGDLRNYISTLEDDMELGIIELRKLRNIKTGKVILQYKKDEDD